MVTYSVTLFEPLALIPFSLGAFFWLFSYVVFILFNEKFTSLFSAY